MKNFSIHPLLHSRKVKKLLMTMKLTALIMLASLLQVSATVYSQATKFNFKAENKQVVEVLKEIEGKSNFRFFYIREQVDVERRVTVKANGATVEQILDEMFADQKIGYKVMDDNLVLLSPDKNIREIESLSAQQKSISGSVTDESGQPLPGVAVVVKGTTQGGVTNVDGEYTIANLPENATLQFSFVGMRTQEVIVGSQATINVQMVAQAIGIDEVVAIGYGTVKKSDLTGAVATVQGDAIAERKTTQISQALQGAMAGVMVTRNNNAPGSTATIRIRGITTIGDSEPLIIVDGVPTSSINDVNPNDVQDISVLKDAASSAIYGSRAAAGVILITTKKAKTGELSLSFNSEFGIERPTRLPENVDAVRYMQIYNERIWNDNQNKDSEYPIFSKDVVDNYYKLNAENPDLYPVTDFIDLIINDYAPRQSHNLSISGGTNIVRTKFNLGYDKTNALYDHNSYERITARMNNDITINNFLGASVDLHLIHSENKQPSMDPMYFMLISAPIYAAEWSDGRIGAGKDGNNIYAQLHHGGFRDNNRNSAGGKLAIEFTPFESFKLSAVVSPSINFNKVKNFQKKIPFYAWDDPTRYLGEIEWAKTTDLFETRNDDYQITSQLLANYSKSLKEHSFNILGGYESYYAFYENLGASREQYQLSSFPYLNLGPLTYRGNSGNAWENGYQSWFGRIMYNYQNKYFLQANIRSDASSRFHKDYRWGTFPSISAGWVISEESFMDNTSWLSYLKLRGSWGSLGNERIGNYPYQATIGFSNVLFHQGSQVVSDQSAAQWQYAIQDISWETTESFDIGIDAYFLNNSLRLSGDYYKKTTKDMLLALEIPNYIGFDNPEQNTGKMNTEGWETELSYNNRVGELNYSASFNISDFKSVMGDLGGTEFLGSQVKMKGSEFNEWYGYVSDGLFQNADEVKDYPTLSSNVKPGDIKYLDISGPDGKPDGKISPEYDRALLGGSLPRYMYGGTIRLDYKGFDFSMVIQGVGKQNSRLSGPMVEPSHWGGIPKVLDGNFWSVYNTPEENLNAKYPRRTETQRGYNYSMSDFWLINGAYFRLKNLTFGYSLPQKIAKTISAENIRIYGSMSDVFTIDNYPKGWDPEVASSGYPITTSLILGVSVKF